MAQRASKVGALGKTKSTIHASFEFGVGKLQRELRAFGVGGGFAAEDIAHPAKQPHAFAKRATGGERVNLRLSKWCRNINAKRGSFHSGHLAANAGSNRAERACVEFGLVTQSNDEDALIALAWKGFNHDSCFARGFGTFAGGKCCARGI